MHWDGHPAPAPPGSINVCPTAGSFVVMTENTTHGTMPVCAWSFSLLSRHVSSRVVHLYADSFAATKIEANSKTTTRVNEQSE